MDDYNIQKQQSSLFDRVVFILEEVRSNVVRAVNVNMVSAYWLIGREIVEKIQKGKKRAEYGKQVIEELSVKLQKRYKKGFSSSNLWYFRLFYSVKIVAYLITWVAGYPRWFSIIIVIVGVYIVYSENSYEH